MQWQLFCQLTGLTAAQHSKEYLIRNVSSYVKLDTFSFNKDMHLLINTYLVERTDTLKDRRYTNV